MVMVLMKSCTCFYLRADSLHTLRSDFSSSGSSGETGWAVNTVHPSRTLTSNWINNGAVYLIICNEE